MKNALPWILLSLVATLAVQAAAAWRLHLRAQDRILALEEQVADSGAAAPAQPSAVEVELATLRARVADLEASPLRAALGVEAALAAAPALEPLDSELVDASTEAEQELDESAEDERARFQALLQRYVAGGYTLEDPEELEEFWRLAKETDLIDDAISELEALVEASPGDLAARMDLADAYTAKLLTLPGGPEQGLWSAKAEDQWESVLERDPDHWGARFALANNYSYYPEFLGKSNEAIRGLERALELQEHLVPEPEHAQTYLSLARMYAMKERTDDALAMLRAGIERHPFDARIAAALADLEQ